MHVAPGNHSLIALPLLPNYQTLTLYSFLSSSPHLSLPYITSCQEERRGAESNLTLLIPSVEERETSIRRAEEDSDDRRLLTDLLAQQKVGATRMSCLVNHLLPCLCYLTLTYALTFSFLSSFLPSFLTKDGAQGSRHTANHSRFTFFLPSFLAYFVFKDGAEGARHTAGYFGGRGT
jgi:hypothetical protein